jgi:hypothetical protein
VELLRSKSLDRDSYNSGDWFNLLDFTGATNNWGAGLPPAEANADNWPLMGPRLADPSLAPESDDIEAARQHLLEMLMVRSSSPLFRLTSAADIADRLAFHNTGPGQAPGVIVMSLSDTTGAGLDPELDSAWVVFNATDEPIELPVAAAAGLDLSLHPVLASSSDPIVVSSAFDPADGSFTVPARTTAAFVEQATSSADTTPPVARAELYRVAATRTSGLFTVGAGCTDDVDPAPTMLAALNGIPVADRTHLLLHRSNRRHHHRIFGTMIVWAPDFELAVTCTDAAGNTSTATAVPAFRRR